MLQALSDLLNQLPAPAWALLAALISAGIAFGGVAITNRSSTVRLQLQLSHELKSKERELRRDRVEELYVLAERFATRLVCDKLPYIKVMQGELTYNQALDMTIATLKEKPIEFERLQAIVDLYFEELSPDLKALFEARDSADKIEADYRGRYKRGELSGLSFVQPMRSALGSIDARSKALQARIAEVGRAISH